MSQDYDAVPGPNNLVEIFEKSVEKHANNRIFGTKNKAGTAYDWVTYREVAKRVDNFRAGLAHIGIGKGDGVAIIANNRTEWAIACYATYGLCARFIPMYETELPRILKFITENSEAKVMIVSKPEIAKNVSHFVDEIEKLEKIIVIDGDGEDTMAALEKIGEANPVKAIHPKGTDIAGLVYTSGTTGNPKGVMLTHGNLACNALAAHHAHPQLCQTDTTLSFLPWAHSFGQTAELHLLVLMGGSTGFVESPKTIVDDMLLVKPTLLVAVPRIFTKIYGSLKTKMQETGGLGKFLFDMGLDAAAEIRENNGKAGLINGLKYKIADKIVFSKIRDKFGGRLKMSLSSSAALNPKIGEFFADIGIEIFEAWGMTELSPAHTVNTPTHNRPGSVGRPILGSSIKIDRTLTGEDSKDGEIIAYGPNVMIGYHNLPEETKKAIRPDGGLATGDRGWVDADGYMYVTGRIKEQYKLENGKYVFPAQLEEAIKLSPFIENVMVYGANKAFNVALIVPDFLTLESFAIENKLPNDPAKLVMEKSVEEFFMNEIKKRCKEYAGYETPRKIILSHEAFSTENGILTPTLKLKRREVVKVYGSRLDGLYEQL